MIFLLVVTLHWPQNIVILYGPQPRKTLTNFKKILVLWNQQEKFYLLMKFEENLRWWADFMIRILKNEEK